MKRFVNAWYQFMHHQWGAVTRSRPSAKLRKYQHIEIQKEFLKLEQARKNERFRLLTIKRKMLGQRLAMQKNLLQSITSQAQTASTNIQTKPNESASSQKQIQQQVSSITSDIAKIQSQLATFDSSLTSIEQKLEQTQSQYVLLTGLHKLIVENQIDYIMYTTMHGFTLHPETQKCVENVHYLVEHNLPVPKYRLYEIMPELFKTEINQLSESARKLIKEKQLVFLEKPSGSMLKPFQLADYKPDQMDQLIMQKNNIWDSINNRATKLLSDQSALIRKIEQGETRWRSFKHFLYYCIDINDEKMFTEEELPLRQAILTVEQYKKDFKDYMRVYEQSLDDLKYRLAIPAWVLDNPKLTQFWVKRHEEIVNTRTPLSEAKFIPDAKFQAKEQLEKRVREELDKVVGPNLKLEGRVRGLINKNEAYDLVLKAFTKVINEIPDEQQLPSGYESFTKLSAAQKQPLLARRLGQLPGANDKKLTINQLTKMIFINNKDPKKYNLEFFSKFFGVEVKLLQTALNSLSFPIVKSKEGDQFNFLRFITTV